MDALQSALFYVLSALTVAAALGVSLAPSRGWRGTALVLVGAGLACLLALLSAAFSGLVVLICFAACGAALSGGSHRRIWAEAAGRWEQAAAVACGLLLAVLLYASWRADFFQGAYPGGSFGSAAVGRLLLARDGLAGDALALMALAAFAAAGLFWRARLR